jgi:hypothetical protein
MYIGTYRAVIIHTYTCNTILQQTHTYATEGFNGQRQRQRQRQRERERERERERDRDRERERERYLQHTVSRSPTGKRHCFPHTPPHLYSHTLTYMYIATQSFRACTSYLEH